MGRWSRQLAPSFISWLQIPAGSHWLDVGCGTGSLSTAICHHAAPGSVLGCDPSEPFIQFAQNHSEDARLSFVRAGTGSLPHRGGGYDSVTSLFALNFFPDPEAAVGEMRSLTAKRGVVSACVWDYSGKMEFLRLFWDTVVTLDPAAGDLDEGKRFPICQPSALSALFRTCGLGDVRCEAIEITTRFADFGDYWKPLLGGTGPAPTYIASLDSERRAILADNLEKALGRDQGKPPSLVARAWAIRGRVD